MFADAFRNNPTIISAAGKFSLFGYTIPVTCSVTTSLELIVEDPFPPGARPIPTVTISTYTTDDEEAAVYPDANEEESFPIYL
ncbi:MAG: hypothetical protein KDD56_06730, partial [Bdellovibrionales bacterium]|nr:hypothetical protein [Bdellovibrionales bacterium]